MLPSYIWIKLCGLLSDLNVCTGINFQLIRRVFGGSKIWYQHFGSGTRVHVSKKRPNLQVLISSLNFYAAATTRRGALCFTQVRLSVCPSVRTFVKLFSGTVKANDFWYDVPYVLSDFQTCRVPTSCCRRGGIRGSWTHFFYFYLDLWKFFNPFFTYILHARAYMIRAFEVRWTK